MKNIFETRRKLFIALGVVCAVIIAANLAIYEISTSNASSSGNNSSTNSSQSSLTSSTSSISTKNSIYQNADLLVEAQVKDLKIPDCSLPGAPSVPVDITTYDYKTSSYIPTTETLGSTYGMMFHNMKNFIGSDQKLKDGYNKVVDILNGKVKVTSPGAPATYLLAFERFCDASFTNAFAVIQKLTYPGMDVAYLLISYGSTQSVTDHSYLPIEFDVLAKKGEDYFLATFQTMYDQITSQNHLAECETESEGNYNYIDSSSVVGHNCVINAYQTDVDQAKVNSLIAQFLKVYKLK